MEREKPSMSPPRDEQQETVLKDREPYAPSASRRSPRIPHGFYGPFLEELSSEMFTEKAPVHKTRRMLHIEARIGESLEDFLAREYEDNERGMRDIGSELGTSAVTIRNWLLKLGIGTRDSAEANWVSREKRGEAMRRAFRKRMEDTDV